MNLRKRGLLTLIAALLAGSGAFAGVEPASSYSFSSSCSSQGLWTQRALEATQDLTKIIKSLRDDPACNGLKVTLQEVSDRAQKEFLPSASTEANSKQTEQIQDLPREIAYLLSVKSAGLNPAMRGAVTNALMDQSVKLATTMSGFLGLGEKLDSYDLGQRTSRMAFKSLDLIDTFLTRLPDVDRCLIGSDNNPTAALAAAIDLMSAVGTRDQGVSRRMAQTLYKLSTVLRDRHYSQALRRMDQARLWTSMSCLLETAEENWCTTHDAMYIFKQGFMTNQEAERTGDKSLRAAKTELPPSHPLAGYYLLIQEVPVVTAWLQKVQIGHDPMLPNDADFQNSVLDSMNEHIKRTKHAQALLSKSMATLNALTSDKKMTVYNMLVNLVHTLTGDFAVKQGDLVNFFTMIYEEKALAFYLMGDKPVPAKVASNDDGVQPIPWEQWVLNGNKFQPEFEDPVALANTINEQFKKLCERAQEKAIEYFNKWFIVDKNSLVMEAVSSMQYSVEESLKHIDRYLSELRGRVIALGGDEIVLGNIDETRDHIAKVLASFQAARDLKKIQNTVDFPTYLEAARQAYSKVIDTTYNEFNMYTQRSGFIATRVVELVHYDYSMILRKGNLNEYEREIYVAARRGIIERMIQLFGQNVANVLTDLQTAEHTYLDNLLTVEDISRDALAPYMAQLQMRVQGIPTSDINVAKNSLRRAYEDAYLKRKNPDPTKCLAAKEQVRKDHPIMSRLTGVMSYADTYTDLQTCEEAATQAEQDNPIRGKLPSMLMRMWIYPDLYPVKIYGRTSYYQQKDIDGTASQVLARLCVQTVGFSRWGYYSNLCDGSVLYSPQSFALFPNQDDDAEQAKAKKAALKNFKPDPFLDVVYAKVANDSLPPKDRICAFRNYNRHTYVSYMTALRQGEWRDDDNVDYSIPLPKSGVQKTVQTTSKAQPRKDTLFHSKVRTR